MNPIIWVLLGVASTLLFYLIYTYWNAPFKLTEDWVGTTFYIFNHENTVAEMCPIYELDPKKKNKGRKFFIPESFGKLEPRKTYDLLKNKEGDLYVRQVAVMLG